MESALKQRLIGAAVLVALAVIFLPMVFDGSRSTDTQTVDLSIPSAPDREFETRVVPLAPGGPKPGAGAPVNADPNRIATVDTAAAPRTDALETPDAAPTPAASRVDDAPAATPPGTTPAAATPAVPPSVPNGRYVVSFGSYSKPDNANALVAQLKRGGVPVYAEAIDVNGKPGLRVRTGPYAMRSEAETLRLLAKRVRADVPGALIEVDDSPAADAPVAAAGSKPQGWAVQVGAFQEQNDANARRDKLRGAGFAAFVDPVHTEKGTLYRVRVGPESVRANADKLRDAVKARFQLDGLVVTHP